MRARALHAHTCTGRAARDSGSSPKTVTDLRPCVVDTGVPLTASMIKRRLNFVMARLCDCRLCEPVLVRPVRPRAPVSAFPEVPVPCGSVEVRDGVRPEPQRGVREAHHRALPDFV